MMKLIGQLMTTKNLYLRDKMSSSLSGLALACLLGPISANAAALVSAEELVSQLAPPQESAPQAERTRSWGATRGLEVYADGGRPKAVVAPAKLAVDVDIPFEFASAQLSQSAHPQLDELAKAIKGPMLKDQRFAIIGHTDAVGDDESNQVLSTLRASAVFNVLTTQYGIAPERLFVQGKGESDLKQPSQPEAATNRRVEIVNLL